MDKFCAYVKNLHISFNGAEILKGIDLNVPCRGITVMLGRSGSGKTTFLRAFNRLNETFTGYYGSGSLQLLLNGNLIDIYGSEAPEPTELRRRAGMVFQTPNPLPLSVYQNMILPQKLVLRRNKEECEFVMERDLRSVGLWDEIKDRLNSPASEFSGGQQQRLCLARTLALEPDLLLLDEPTASLDKKSSAFVEELLLSLNKQYPMIVVSHSLAQAQRLGSTFAVLNDGIITRTMSSDDLYGKEVQSILENLL